MAQQIFRIKFTFTSTLAYGNEYHRYLDIRANSAANALATAHIDGARMFGHLFTDNCTDWEVVVP